MPVARQRETGLKRPGSHLRSLREVLGYSVHTTDGEAGSVEDFIIEDTLWGVHHVVVALEAVSLPVDPGVTRIDSIHLLAGQGGLGEPVAPGARDPSGVRSGHAGDEPRTMSMAERLKRSRSLVTLASAGGIKLLRSAAPLRALLLCIVGLTCRLPRVQESYNRVQ